MAEGTYLLGKDRYKALFERSADAILIIKGGRFVDCNQATVNMLRYRNKTDLLNTHPSELSPQFQPDGRASYEKADEMIDSAFRNGSHRFDWDHKRADGEVFPVEVLLTAVEENGEKTLHVVWRDITQRKKKEADLLRINSIIEATSDLISSATPDGRVFYFNAAARKLFGDRPIGTVMIPDLHPDWAYERISTQGIPFAIENGLWEGETAAYTADGREIPVSQVITAHKDADGKLLYLSTIMRDMTEHYQNRAERMELQNRLHHAQKMEAIGTLAGGIAHDFNNILSGIFGYCQLAKNHMAAPEKAKAHIDEIVRGARKAAELIQQILTFSRKSPHLKRPLRMSVLIKEVLKLLRASIPATIEIREEINTRGRVLADATKIHQVMMNICTNAYQAMLDTGGILTVCLDALEIQNDASIPAGRYIRLTVKDTGPGIEKDHLDKIFEPYFTTKIKGKGTGMGLAVVHGIVDEHKGVIRVDSQVGKGTSFIILLPATQTDAKSDAQPEPDQGTLPSDAGHDILLVDDEAGILNSTTHLLKYQGYKVTPVSDGKAALDIFEQAPERFDLVISDITMPGITGDKLARRMLELNPELPIILCSGYTEKITEADALALGISRFLRKPIIFNDLVKIIQSLLPPQK